MLLQVDAHGSFVGHETCCLDADPGQSEPLRDSRGDRHRAIARDRDDSVDRVAPADLDDLLQVIEVGRLSDVGHVEADRGRVSIDSDDAPTGFPGLADCRELGDARPQKEHGRHAGRS